MSLVPASTIDSLPSPGIDPSPPRAHRILIAEDDAAIRTLSTRLLRRSGYDVRATADGAEAWAALVAAPYDLLITDHNMPEMSGLDLMRKVHAASLSLPIIMASGYLPEESLTDATWFQPAALIQKPYTAAEFLGTVQQVLRAPEARGGCLLPPYLPTPPGSPAPWAV